MRGCVKRTIALQNPLIHQFEMNLHIDGNDDIDFSGIDEDLEQFQQDDIVRQALLRGVDLRGYARDIDLELREVKRASYQ